MQISNTWEIVEKLLQAKGLELFDVDMPQTKGGMLRVFISKPGVANSGITHQDCVMATRALLEDEQFLSVVGDEASLEVSSPGVNRKLRRLEHFLGALGEHIKVTLNNSSAAAQSGELVIKGTLKAVAGSTLTIEKDRVKMSKSKAKKAQISPENVVQIELGEIAKAKVDFEFK